MHRLLKWLLALLLVLVRCAAGGGGYCGCKRGCGLVLARLV